MAHSVEKVEECSMHANRMCKGSVAEGSMMKRRAATVATMGEGSEGKWVELDLARVRLRSLSFPKDTGEPLKALKE